MFCVFPSGVGLGIGAVSYPYTAKGALGREVLERSGDMRKDDRWHTAYVLQFTKLVEGDLLEQGATTRKARGPQGRGGVASASGPRTAAENTPEKRDDIAPDSEVGRATLNKDPRTETVEKEFSGSLQSPDSSLSGYFSPTPLERKHLPAGTGRILDGPRKPVAGLVSRILFDLETQRHWDVYWEGNWLVFPHSPRRRSCL